MKIKLADYVIQYLSRYGISDIFVVYGSANGDLIDAFSRTDKTRYVAIMHEQAAGFAAEGWTKTKQKSPFVSSYTGTKLGVCSGLDGRTDGRGQEAILAAAAGRRGRAARLLSSQP